MRVLVCDHQVVFAESLAHVLTARSAEVVAVTYDIDGALDVLGREAVDVCLLDVVFGQNVLVDRLAELRAAAPRTRLLLLSGNLDRTMVEAARAAGVDAMADKRQPAADLLRTLHRLSAGEPLAQHPRMAVDASMDTPRRPANDAQRLASFLTPREREVLSALVRGDNTGTVARSLGITVATARCHIQKVLMKMGAHSRLEVATTAVRYGMVDPETGEWLTVAFGAAVHWAGVLNETAA
jgi:two-component system nitrate/nitrite response regulator NarL